MEKLLTSLEKGIIVKIDSEQAKLLNELPGYLSKDSYPPFYKEISLENEIGRFLKFRFIQS